MIELIATAWFLSILPLFDGLTFWEELRIRLRHPTPPYGEQYGVVDYAGKTVVDVGADFGSTATFFLSQGASKVVAVEPDNTFFKRLKRHPDCRVVPLRMWVDGVSDVVWLITEYHPDVLKMDCEGCEKYVIDVPNSIFSIPGEYLIETHSDDVFHAVRDKLLDNGYSLSCWHWKPGICAIYAWRG